MTSPNDCLDCLDMVSPYRDARENAEKREMKCDCWTTCTDYDGHGEIFSIDFCPLHAAAPQLLEACEAVVQWADNTPGPDMNKLIHAMKLCEDAIRAAKSE